MTRQEHRRFEELLDRHFEQLRELWGACEDKAHIKCVADGLLSRLFQRLNQEIPYLTTAEGAREALHVLAVRQEIERADLGFELATRRLQG